MKKRSFFLLFFLLFLAFGVSGHEEKHETVAESIFHLWNPLWVLFAAALITVFVVFLSLLFTRRITNTVKKIFFGIIVAVLGLATLYLVAATLYTNIQSETKGPAH